MKTIFRFLGLAILIAGFTAAGGTSIFAQDPAATPTPDPCDTNREARTALEDKVRASFNNADILLRQPAVDAGEEYIKTYGSDPCESAKAFITYLNGYIPPTKTAIAAEKKRKARAALLARFDPAVVAGNWDEVYSAGKELVAMDPDIALNQVLVLGSIGLDETLKSPRVTKYNDDTLKYARMAIDMLNAGKTSKTFGFGKFYYGVKDKPDSKEVNPAASKANALGWMNYTIGAIGYFDKNNKKDALGYLYKATQANSQTQKLPQIYAILGDYYYDEVVRLGDEIKKKTEEAGNKDTDETKALIAQQKGYDERGIDAYGRAQSLISPTDPKQKAYREGIGGRIETLYKVRFEKTDGLTAFVSSQIAKPLPDPSTVPAPIVEAETVPATTGTAPAATPAAPGAKPATPGTKPVATPANTNGTKPAVTAPATTKKPVSVNGTTDGTTTAAAKPAAKKPVVKKKGTR